MDYIVGFEDATEMVMQVANKAIKQLEESDKTVEDYELALDRFLSLAYILQFQASNMEDEYLENLFIDAYQCGDYICEHPDYNKDLEYDEVFDIGNLLNEIFNGGLCGKADKEADKEEF